MRVLIVLALLAIAGCQAPQESAVALDAAAACPADKFVGKFKSVGYFDYAQTSLTFDPPRNVAPVDARTEAFLRSVHSITPPQLQRFICSRNVDFVALYKPSASNDDDNFAFWPSSAQERTPGVPFLLGIPLARVGYGATAPASINDSEETLLKRLVSGNSGGSPVSLSVRFGYEPLAPAKKDREIAFLSMLSHEAGHLLWHRGRGVRRCGDQQPFIQGSWGLSTEEIAGYHGLGEDFSKHLDPVKDPEYRTVIRKLRLKDTSGVQQLLRRDGRFSSLLAAESPDEDFAESYRFRVLSELGVSKARIQIEDAIIELRPSESLEKDRKHKCVDTVHSSVLARMSSLR